MSSIEKLSIQGIRSFGPNTDDMQSLSFVSPLTLIVGENGCGKTTIIECLKYALTGESPPGSDRGKNFIHDPKIFNRSDALGQIKLQVSNIRGERVSVCRSMKISMRRGKYTFETLDSTMNNLQESGNESLSKRVADVDGAMCQFMGVSKAIINNVLFCHQEDSSWPLDEPKKLKEKFDAIFGTTEYNKAIEDIIKLRKTQMEELKLIEANNRHFAHVKQEMESKAMSLESSQLKQKKIEEQCEKFETDMEPINKRLAEIRDIEMDIGKHQARKVAAETRLKSCNDQISSLQKKIKTPYAGDLVELERELDEFDNKMCVKQAEQEEQQEHLKGLRAQEKELQQSLSALDKKCFELKRQATQHRECATDRARKIQKLCSALDRECPTTLLDEESVLSALQGIEASLKERQENLKAQTASNDEEDQRRQLEIDDLRVELTKVEQQISTLQEQEKRKKTEHAGVAREMHHVEKSAERLKQLIKDIEVVSASYEKVQLQYNKEDFRASIDKRKERVNSLQQQFHKLDERHSRLSAISKQLVEISLKEQELEKREIEVRRLKSKHSDELKKLFAKPLDNNYRRSVQQIHDKFQKEITNLNAKVNENKKQEQTFQIQRKNLKEEVQRWEKELEDCEEKIHAICRSNKNYKNVLNDSKAMVDKCQLDYGALRSADAMYKKYLHKIEEDPYCPLCHKNMQSNELNDLSAELQDEIQQLPENIKRAENALKLEEKRYEKLLKLQPVIERSEQLNINIPKRKEELKVLDEKLQECLNEGESLEIALVEPNMNLATTSALMSDMLLLDEAIKVVNRLQQEIQVLKQKLPKDHDSNATLEDLQLEKSTISAELNEARKKLDKMQHEYEKLNEELQSLREQKNRLKDEQIKLQEGVQNLPQLKERYELLSKQLEESQETIRLARTKVQPLKQRLNEAVAEKSKQKEIMRKQLAKMQKELETHRNAEHEIKRLHNQIVEYQKLNLDEELKSIEEKLENKKQDIEKKNEEIQNANAALDIIRKECTNQQIMERDLKDNRELKHLQQQHTTIKEHCVELERQLSGLDLRKISREKTTLRLQHDEAMANRGKLMGQLGEIKNQIEKLEHEMNQPLYKDAVGNYRRSYYEKEVTRAVIADLGQYRLALEWSLMQFHKAKMEKINRLIREYWRLIYRGNDIDYIQIQTDEGEQTVTAAAAGSAADRRRSYNYRVVQSKNDTVIEMRGRCSAGQRVLASLIIRMALAETFSSNCGVLALDEPTTNLDRINIVSLCDALNRIVDERQTQCNFMLIIITHDEEFISMLGRVDSYYRVFRSDQCKSVIRLVQNS